MNAIYMLVLVLMVACLALTGIAIWNWGPGIRRRTVACPVKNRRAKVIAQQVEGDFACLRVTDIKRCSLIEGAFPTCGRPCMRVM